MYGIYFILEENKDIFQISVLIRFEQFREEHKKKFSNLHKKSRILVNKN